MKQLFFLISILGALYGTANAKHYPAPDNSGPVLTFVNHDTLYDFDAVRIGDQVSNLFEIKNTGDAPLIITGITCKAGNVACHCDHKTLKPGKTGIITVTYSADGTTGSFMHDIVINSNSIVTANPAILIKGAIVPANTAIPPKAGKSPHGRGGRSKMQ